MQFVVDIVFVFIQRKKSRDSKKKRHQRSSSISTPKDAVDDEAMMMGSNPKRKRRFKPKKMRIRNVNKLLSQNKEIEELKQRIHEMESELVQQQNDEIHEIQEKVNRFHFD